MRRIVAVAVVLLSLATGIYAQQTPEGRELGPVSMAQASMEGFDEVVEQALEDFVVPGAAIAVVLDGEIVYAEGFGFRDLEAQKPMTADTLFAIGSTTKAMTTTVLGMLADEGKLDWDEPLRRFLPTFELSDRSISERVTPRDIVTHRTGLPRHDYVWYNNNEGTRAEIVARMAHLELTADLREMFQYNNLMYMTAGYLAGVLTDSTWEEAMRGRLFGPLGMDRTNFSVNQSQKDADFAYPYEETDEHENARIPFRNIDLIGPAGSVNSSVNEMSKWLAFNLNEGRVGEEQLINPATLADIHSPHMTTGASPDRPDISQATYGMGWSIDTYRGHRRVSHGGGIDGFITSVVMFPDQNLGLVAFNNGQSGISSLITQHAADRLLGLEPVEWLGEAKERREKGLESADEAEERKDESRRAGTAPSHPIADYTGEYSHPGYGTMTISQDGEALRLLYNGIDAPLEHWHYDVWNGAETDGDEAFESTKFLFRGDVDGNVAAVESVLEARAQPIVFTKGPPAALSDPEVLAGFAGSYERDDGIKLVVDLVGDALTLSIPGQPTYHLEPDLNGRFVLQEVRVVSLEFVTGDDGETAIRLHSPGSINMAKRVD
jgi:CubicO group peptidase (beta-lactamase class C family)